MISGSVEQTERPAGGPAGEEASLDGKRGEKVSDEVGSGLVFVPHRKPLLVLVFLKEAAVRVRMARLPG